LINDKLLFSKLFYDAKEAENSGFDMIKSSDWYNFIEDVKNIDYKVIDIESGERVSEPMGIIYLERDENQRVTLKKSSRIYFSFSFFELI